MRNKTALLFLILALTALLLGVFFGLLAAVLIRVLIKTLKNQEKLGAVFSSNINYYE